MDLFQLLTLNLGWGVLLRSPISNGPCSKVLFLNVYLKKIKKKAPGVAWSTAFAAVTSLPSP